MSFRENASPRMNLADLVMICVAGEIAHPIGRSFPYRIGYDGIPRILPGTGGINLSQRTGDRCVGLAGDHIEPGISLRNNRPEIIGDKQGPNLALLTYACVGNVARITTGPCRGSLGIVTGKHGGIEHLLADFPPATLRRLRIGDKVQVYSYGLGLRLIDHPQIQVFNCSPRLIRGWRLKPSGERLKTPITHFIPAAVMGSGVGRNNAVRGDYDIQLFDPEIRRRFKLDTLRFGDFVAVVHSDSRFGRAYRRGTVTVGVIVHGDSVISGHGPGVLALLTAESRYIEPVIDSRANLAVLMDLRQLPPVSSYSPLVQTPARPESRCLCKPLRLPSLPGEAAVLS